MNIIIVARRQFGIPVDSHPTEPPDVVVSRPQCECRNKWVAVCCFDHIDLSVFLFPFQVEKERRKDGLPLEDR